MLQGKLSQRKYGHGEKGWTLSAISVTLIFDFVGWILWVEFPFCFNGASFFLSEWLNEYCNHVCFFCIGQTLLSMWNNRLKTIHAKRSHEFDGRLDSEGNKTKLYIHLEENNRCLVTTS